MKLLKMALAAASIAAALPGVAAATTYTIDVTASDFFRLSGPGGSAPAGPVTVDYTLTLDPTVASGPTKTGLVVDSSVNLPDATGGFAYTPSSSPIPSLTIGTNVFNASEAADGANTYSVYIADPFSGVAFVSFEETDAKGNLWEAEDANAVVTAVVSSAAPEPAAWAMMLVGVFGVGSVLRSRRKVFAAA